MPQSRKPDPTLRAAAEVSPPSPPAPTIVGRPTLEAARRIGESVIVAAITSAGLYLVGSVYTDAYYGRLSIETTSLDLAPPYVALQSVHVLQALLEYPSILLLLFVLYQTFARPARRLRLQIERTRQRFPRLLLVLANLIVVAPLLVSAFFHTYQGRAMAERSLLAPVASGLERASLILLAYAIWLGWNQRAFIVSQIRARQLVPIALVFSVYLLTTLLATAGTATVAAESLLTGTSEASLGVVSVGTLWADAGIYYPLAVEPYTPERWFPGGKADPAFRTKPQIALELVDQAIAQDWPFRAVVADCFYGEHRGFTRGLTQRGVPYVVALKPSHAWWAPVEAIGAVREVADGGGWVNAEQPGAWQPIVRQYRHGHQETWWALEGVAGPFGPDRGAAW